MLIRARPAPHVPGIQVARPDPEALRFKGYIPGLDVLRGIAILMVLLYHGFDGRVPWQNTTGWMRWPLLAAQYGSSGVQLFYVLSGFLISSILLDTAGSKDYYRKFYVRRALRIMPAYLLMLVVLKLDHIVSWKFVLAALLYIANMASLVGAKSSEYGALWSLAVEEQFYLIWPMIVRRCSPKTLTRIIIGYLVFGVLLRLLFEIYFPRADATYKLWFNADMLLSGALVSICLRRNLLRRDKITRLFWMLAGLALLAWPAIVALDVLDVNHSSFIGVRVLYAFYHFPFMLTYVALLLLVLKFNKGAASVAKRCVVTQLLAFLGYISYGLYLVHQLVFTTYDRMVEHTALGDYALRPGMLVLSVLICTAISIALAYLSRRFFEEIFLRQKDKVVPYKNPDVNEAPVSEPA
jgi:peptidoglycan/LPS O-acetylase OafA/YrhL